MSHSFAGGNMKIIGILIIVLGQVSFGICRCLEKRQDNADVAIVYTRWGHTECRGNGELVYSGWTAGGHYLHPGAPVEPVCLPRKPNTPKQFFKNKRPSAFIYGSEYEFQKVTDNDVQNHDVPCAVCRVTGRATMLMIPGRTKCFGRWVKEYQGFLMAGRNDHIAASKFTCVDEATVKAHAGRVNKDGYLFYPVAVQCGSLDCPPYINDQQLACVVCSK